MPGTYTGRVEVTLAGGLVVDVATKDDLQRHHESLRDELIRLIGEKRDVQAYRIYGSSTTTSGFTGTGPIPIAFNPTSPPSGRLWVVQFVTAWVGTTVAAGTTANLNCAVMCGQSPSGGGLIGRAVNVNVSDVVIPTQAVPNPPTGTPDVFVVKSENQLYVLLAGSALAASTVYNAAALVIDLPAVPGAVIWH